MLLLDEPLGALDLRLRKDMQNELKRIQQQMGITFIYVTHDQEEALTMSDTVVVMDKGRIQQIGTPEDIYNEPKNAFVADFIGESNILDGIMRARLRGEDVHGKEFPCVDERLRAKTSRWMWSSARRISTSCPWSRVSCVGTVTNVTFKGMQYDIIVDFRGFKWLIQTTDHSAGGRAHRREDRPGRHPYHEEERVLRSCSETIPPTPRNTRRLDGRQLPSRKRRRARMKNKLSRFAVPYVVWMALFVVAPIVIMVVLRLRRQRRRLHAGQLRADGRLRRGLQPLVQAGADRHG